MRRLLLASTVAVLLLAVPAAEGASVRRVEPAIDGTVVTDGKHAAAYQPRRGVVAVVQTDGDTVESPIPAGCTLVDVAGPTVLFSCPPAPPDTGMRIAVPVLYDSDAGTYSHPPGMVLGHGFLALPGSESITAVTALGDRWIAGTSTILHGGTWATPIYQPRFTAPPPAIALLDGHHLEDLDAAGRARPLCAPLTAPFPRDDGSRDSPDTAYTYAKPWALRRTGPDSAQLYHCGESRPRRLPCRRCADISLSGRWLAWGEPRRLVVRDLRTGRTRRWKTPDAQYRHITMTQDAVLLALAPSPALDRQARFALYRADLR